MRISDWSADVSSSDLILDQGIPCIACIVDYDVEPIELLHRGTDKALREPVRGNAAVDGDCLAATIAHFPRHGIARLFIQIIDDDARALSRQFQRYGPADPAARTRYQSHFPIKLAQDASPMICCRPQIGRAHV